jgi:hypothetical protein
VSFGRQSHPQQDFCCTKGEQGLGEAGTAFAEQESPVRRRRAERKLAPNWGNRFSSPLPIRCPVVAIVSRWVALSCGTIASGFVQCELRIASE